MARLLFDRAQQMSWNGVRFPVRSLEIVGEARHHLHEYPHQSGADLEKLGRKAYVIRADAFFDEGVRTYGSLYPAAVEAIASYAEAELTGKLVTPQAGSIQAYCAKWPRRWTADVRSGETMALEWVEDQAITDLDVFTSGPTVDMLDDLTTKVIAFKYLDPSIPFDLFDALRDLVNSVLSIRDQVDLQVSLFAAKLEGIKDMIGQIDRALTTPLGWPIVQALADLWNAADTLANDVSGGALAIRSFVVPRLMDIMQVARLVFGRTDKAMDLLQLNAVDDALAIPAGTSLRYIVDPGQVTV